MSVDSPVALARHTFTEWALRPLEKRIQILHAYQKLLQTYQKEMAQIISEEVGKPLWDAEGEVQAMLGKVEISIEAYKTRTGSFKEGHLVLRHRPHGVVAIIGPYNFPGHLPSGHIIPALLAGNTVLFKPSKWTPKTAELLLTLWLEAGLPKGALQLVHDGKALASHPQIDGLFFTGSLNVGLALSQQFANQPGKILALEMGGNNPLIFWDAKESTAALYTVIQSAFVTSGQRCTCARRLILQDDSFLRALIQAVSHIDAEKFMGRMVSQEAAQKIVEAEAKLGGKKLVPLSRKGAFLTPGLIDVTDVKELPDEEIFGPLLQVQRVTSFDQALSCAFKTKFGLVASLISEERKLYDRFYIHSKAGVVNWNAPTTGASSRLPFGGLGCSGNLRPSGSYAADYCAAPIASSEYEQLLAPKELPPGLPL